MSATDPSVPTNDGVPDEGAGARAQGAESVGPLRRASPGEPVGVATEPRDASDPDADATPSAGVESGAVAGDGTQASGDEEDDAGSEGVEVAATADEPGPEAGRTGGRRRRRRRRGRRREGEGSPPESAEATDGASKSTQDGPEDGAKEPRREAPFARWLDGNRRTRIGAGEIVGGRVERVDGEVIVVDLFGRATAFVDVREPREVPKLPLAAGGSSAAGLAAPAEESGADASVAPESPPGVSEAADGNEAPAASGHGVPSDAEHVAAAQVVQDEAFEAEESESGEEPDEGGSTTGMVASAPELESEPPPPPAVGSVFRGRVAAVSESGHVAIVNRVVDPQAVHAALREASTQARRVRGIVFGFNRGGFDVLVEGVRLFCPANGLSLEPVDDPSVWLGRKLEFRVLPRREGMREPIVSRRGILLGEQRKARRARLQALRPGDRVTARVSEVREFGAFVDMGDGLVGFVPASEVAWQRGVRPADVMKPGDEVELVVLRAGVEGRTERVALSRKATLPDPWDEHAAILVEGTARSGKIVKVAEFGAFVELAPGVEGLLPARELGRDAQAIHGLREGQGIDVVVERVDRAQRRIALSRASAADARSMTEAGAEASRPPPREGEHVTVVVEKLEHQGVHVQVRGVVGKRGRGYVPNRELGSLDGAERRKALAPGTSLEVKVIGIERDGTLRCSVRARQLDEERRAVRDYRREAARQGFGTFGDLLRAKLEKR
ncbi:MAG: S1 RNA-binding domain-containing protein [Myxococcales bacterium]|nr:S1 RNA-binding domain-containing protein [Myxococcales bacterium]